MPINIMMRPVYTIFIIILMMGISSPLYARTLEQKEEADPVSLLKKEQQQERKKEMAEIEELKAEIDELLKEIGLLDGRITDIDKTRTMEFDVLDKLHELVVKKEELQDELQTKEKDLSKKETKLAEADDKRQRECDALVASLKKDKRKQRSNFLKQDIKKYEKITKSPSVQNMDVSDPAWRALAAKYPQEAAGVTPGDLKELEFKVKYGGMTNSMGMRFVLIQAGAFKMGSPEDEPFRSMDETQHKVIIRNAYYLQTTEVTRDQWIEIMGDDPSEFKFCGGDCPIENVSWEECQEFIRRLNQRENTDKYRLPTEAEWEYASRAGKRSAFFDGDITVRECGIDPVLNEIGWYCANSRRMTRPVARKKMNPWGLFDMNGNVWEWCSDWYGPYPEETVADPQGPPYGPNRVIRGGSCLNYVEKCRSAFRFSYRPYTKMNNIGFRLARSK